MFLLSALKFVVRLVSIFVAQDFDNLAEKLKSNVDTQAKKYLNHSNC